MLNIRNELIKLPDGNPSEWKRVDHLAGNLNSFCAEENGKSYCLEFRLPLASLPSEEKIITFLNRIMPWDNYFLNFKDEDKADYEKRDFRIEKDYIKNGFPQREYAEFAERFVPGSPVLISLTITKRFREDGICSVYDWEAFAEFLLRPAVTKEAPEGLPAYLNQCIKDYPGGIRFLVLDAEADFRTGAVAFENEPEKYDISGEERQKALDRYNGASLFMGRTENVLLPGDFHVKPGHDRLPDPKGEAVSQLFMHYETVYSLLYLASASWFEKESLVLQFTKGGIEFWLPVDAISYNPHIYELILWAFEEGEALERAEIVRDVVNLYCRDKEAVLNIREGILRASRSNFRIYKRKTVDKYVALKKGLSDGILASAKQLQEMVSSLSGGFEKNFIAVVTVIISEVLAKHITWEKIEEGVFRKPDFHSVILIFSIASFLYLIVTLISIRTKWGFYTDRYSLLKEQYKGLLDDEELNEAFQNDKLINEAKSKLILHCTVISLIWCAMLLAVYFAGTVL